MFLSNRERENRYRAVRQRMAEAGLDAIIARGSSAVRGDGAAFRFLTAFPNINIPLVCLFFRNEQEKPVLLVESRFQAMRAEKQSWAEDIRLSTNFFQSLTEVLKEKRLEQAAIGIDGLHNFPFLWGQKIEESFPSIRLTEFGPALKKLRAYRTPEEVRLVKKSAALVDRFGTNKDNSLDLRPVRGFEHVDGAGDIDMRRLVEGGIALFGPDRCMHNGLDTELADGL